MMATVEHIVLTASEHYHCTSGEIHSNHNDSMSFN